MQQAELQDSDDDNVTAPQPVRPVQQRIEDKQQKLTEQQLDKLLRLNDMFNSGDIQGDLGDLQLAEILQSEFLGNTTQTNPGTVPQHGLDLSSLVSSSGSGPPSVLDHADFGRSATHDMVTDHTDYALLNSSRHGELDVFGDATHQEGHSTTRQNEL